MNPTIMTTSDLGKEYAVLLEHVRREGTLVRPRGLPCREASPLVLTLTDPTRCIVRRPGFSSALMWLEIAQLIAGVCRPDLMAAVSPNAASMVTPYGAYGPRVKEQLEEVVAELTRDPDSRRAVVYVGRPDDLRLAACYEPTSLDMPCTLTWQFLVRDGAVDLLVTMRSWDLVWGLSYDIPCFVAMQQVVSRALGKPVGEYAHVAGSGHVYERHWELKPEPCDEQLHVEVAMRALSDSRRMALEALEGLAQAVASQGIMHGSWLERIAHGEATGWQKAAKAWYKRLLS